MLIVFVFSNVSLVFSTSTSATIQVKPNPVGVGQAVLVCLRVEPSPIEAGIASGRWEEISVEVTRPDGSVTTISGLATDPSGVASITYVPDMVGSWSFQMSFPGYSGAGVVYDPSVSEVVELFVQQDPVDYELGNLTCDFLDTECPCFFWVTLVIILIIIIIILLTLLIRRRK